MSIPVNVKSRVRSRPNEGTVVRSTVLKNRSEVVKQSETVERFVGVDEPAPAYVSIGGKVTKNLGNYESLQISVSVTLPCAPTEEAVLATRAIASRMVDEFSALEFDNFDAGQAGEAGR